MRPMLIVSGASLTCQDGENQGHPESDGPFLVLREDFGRPPLDGQQQQQQQQTEGCADGTTDYNTTTICILFVNKLIIMLLHHRQQLFVLHADVLSRHALLQSRY